MEAVDDVRYSTLQPWIPLMQYGIQQCEWRTANIDHLAAHRIISRCVAAGETYLPAETTPTPLPEEATSWPPLPPEAVLPVACKCTAQPNYCSGREELLADSHSRSNLYVEVTHI